LTLAGFPVNRVGASLARAVGIIAGVRTKLVILDGDVRLDETEDEVPDDTDGIAELEKGDRDEVETSGCDDWDILTTDMGQILMD
jgi:hypothetical protein